MLNSNCMTPQQKLFLPPFCKAVLEWEATQTLPFKRVLSTVTVAQAALETGWGKSSLCKVNNYGGIKWHIPGWPPLEKPTTEVYSGKVTPIVDKFQTYPTIADFITDHSAVLLRWRCVRDALGLGVLATCEALGPWSDADRLAMKAGRADDCRTSNYSTDPKYGGTLMGIIEGISLQKTGQLEAYAAGTFS